MRALDRKAVRDLWHLRGQVVAISLVVASGVAVLIMSLSTLEALRDTADAYYERQQFADVFAGVTRAPNRLAATIAAIDGVKTVQTRVVKLATLDIAGFAEPVMAKLVSLPASGAPVLNQLVLRSGRLVDPDHSNEIVLTESFSDAHELFVGDQFVAVLNGNRRTMTVVGTALSPEFIYSLGPGALMADDLRFGVMWMGEKALASAFDLTESFNDVALKLDPGASAGTVISQLDQMLARYGGIGAISRDNQLSNWFVTNEIEQQGAMARLLPSIFLAIAAVLTHMVLSRLIATERSQIGLMKAFGYSNFEVGFHYVKIVLGIIVFGLIIGSSLGIWFGRFNIEMYARLFRFPILVYQPSVEAFFIAAITSSSAALLGAITSVRRASTLPPAQAMQPPAPPAFQRSWLARSRFGQWLDQPTRIVARHLGRWPLRALLTSMGLAAAIAVQVLAFQWNDSLDYLAQSVFFDAQRQHAMIGLNQPQSINAIHEIEHLPGVLAAEPSRIVAVDFAVSSATHRGSLAGVLTSPFLQPIYDDRRHAEISAPANGLVLGSQLASKLGVGIGDLVSVSLLEGRRPTVQIAVVDLVDTFIGMPAYIHLDALNRLLYERPSFQQASLLIDATHEATFFARLKNLPAVSSVMLRQAAIDSYYSTVVDHLQVFIQMFTGLACALAFGVAYNSTRISLSERGRELATLRVLGFRRGEISYILLGEMGVLTVLALPLGCLFGYALAAVLATAFDTELFRIPLTISSATYGKAMLIVLLACGVSALIVRRRVDRLNLIEVLKTRE